MSNRSDWKLIESLVVRATCGQRVVLREGSPRREMLTRALLRYTHPEWEDGEWHARPYSEYCLVLMHATSGGMIDIAKPDRNYISLVGSKPIELYEICFSCGAKRLVDIDPLWMYHVIFRGVNEPITFCDECGPTIYENMGEEQEDLVHMNDLEAACDRRPWLADHTVGFMLEDAIKHWTTGIGYESVISRGALETL
jgi:hypothetical protein